MVFYTVIKKDNKSVGPAAQQTHRVMVGLGPALNMALA